MHSSDPSAARGDLTVPQARTMPPQPLTPTGTPQGPRALLIQADGQGSMITLPANPAAAASAIAGLIGGTVDTVFGAGWCAYVCRHGLNQDMPWNAQADAIARALQVHFTTGARLRGPAVFVGRVQAADADVPETVLTMARVAGVIP